MSDDIMFDRVCQYTSLEYPVLHQAVVYHRTHQNKPIRFKNHEYLKAIYKDKSHHIVAKKGTQSCVSEFLICFSTNKAIEGKNVFYIFPTDIIKARFVQARINKTIEYTEYYRSLMKNIDSANMKAFDTGIINFIGSNSQANFAEFVAPVIIIDEKDFCNLDNLVMAKERQAKQEMEDRFTIEVSNPTILDYGIDESFNESDKKYWMNKCSCGEWQTVDFFKNIVRQEDDDYIIIDKDFEFQSNQDCNIICYKCGNPIDRFGKGEWISEATSEISGYQFTQFFTSPTPIRDHIKQFQKGLTNERELQRFYNAVLGLGYTSSGAKILKSMLYKEDYNELDMCSEPCLLGIDVGTNLHCVIGKVSPDKTVRIIKRLTLKSFDDIVDLHRRYNIVSGVIDSKPEMRLSRQIVTSLPSMWMCDYLTETPKDSIDIDRKIIKTDRTTSLDGVKESILLKQFIFPQTENKEFEEHLEALTRVWQSKENHVDLGRYVWVQGNKPDHYLHALNYMSIALRLLVMARG